MISRQFYDKPYHKIPGVLDVYGHCQEIHSGSKTFNMELSLKIGGICVAFLNMQPRLKEKRSRINNLFCDFLFKTIKVLDEVKTEKKMLLTFRSACRKDHVCFCYFVPPLLKTKHTSSVKM